MYHDARAICAKIPRDLMDRMACVFQTSARVRTRIGLRIVPVLLSLADVCALCLQWLACHYDKLFSDSVTVHRLIDLDRSRFVGLLPKCSRSRNAHNWSRSDFALVTWLRCLRSTPIAAAPTSTPPPLHLRMQACYIQLSQLQ